MKQTIFDRWEVSAEVLTEIVDANPSLRGFLLGYLAEYKVREKLINSGKIQELRRYDDHDRKKKNDLVVLYSGQEITIEVKSLQTNTIRKTEKHFEGKVQCDASDSRRITLPTGEKVTTTCLLVGEFDVLAVNLFAFEQEWRFGFIRNHDLPRSKYRKYTLEQREYLLATTVTITWPLLPPFREDPFEIFDEIIRERA